MTNPKSKKSVRNFLGGICAMLFATAVHAENYPAVLQWSRRVELGTPVSGVIQSVMVAPGDKVTKGSVLLQVDDQVLKARVQSAEANQRSQDEHYKEVQRELQRTTEMYNRTLISDHELQIAKNNDVQARAELEKARTALVQAKNNLQYSQVRAPFNALILARNAEPGKVIAAELKPEPLLIVADADRMLARIYVTELVLSRIHKGVSAQVRVGDQEFTGSVSAIGLEPDTTTKPADATRYPVEVEFSTSGKLLRAGQHASVELP